MSYVLSVRRQTIPAQHKQSVVNSVCAKFLLICLREGGSLVKNKQINHKLFAAQGDINTYKSISVANSSLVKKEI